MRSSLLSLALCLAAASVASAQMMAPATQPSMSPPAMSPPAMGHDMNSMAPSMKPEAGGMMAPAAPTVGSEAKPLTLPDTTGTSVSLADLRKDTPVIVIFLRGWVGEKPAMSEPKMSEPKMSDPKMTDPKMSPPKMSDDKHEMGGNNMAPSMTPPAMTPPAPPAMGTPSMSAPMMTGGMQCPLCTAQYGDLRAHAADFKAAHAKLLLVYPGSPAHAKEFLATSPLPEGFTLVTDQDLAATTAWNLRWNTPGETAYPSSFIVDPTGKITFAKTSHSHGDRATSAELLKALPPKM